MRSGGRLCKTSRVITFQMNLDRNFCCFSLCLLLEFPHSFPSPQFTFQTCFIILVPAWVPNLQFVRTNYVRQLLLFSRTRWWASGAEEKQQRLQAGSRKALDSVSYDFFHRKIRKLLKMDVEELVLAEGQCLSHCHRECVHPRGTCRNPPRYPCRNKSCTTHPLSFAHRFPSSFWALERSLNQPWFWESHFRKCGALAKAD